MDFFPKQSPLPQFFLWILSHYGGRAEIGPGHRKDAMELLRPHVLVPWALSMLNSLSQLNLQKASG
jgi:hypothetical protein